MLFRLVIAAAIGSPIGGGPLDRYWFKDHYIYGLAIATIALFLLSVVLKYLVYFYCAEAFFLLLGLP